MTATKAASISSLSKKDDDDDHDEINGGGDDSPAATPCGVFCNLTNSIVGAGVISIPHAMAQGGFLPICGLLVLCAFITLYAMNTIVRLGSYHHVDSFEDLAQVAFGIKGYLAVCFFQLTFSFGANCSYLVVIADTIPVVIGRLWNMHFARGEPVPSSHTPWYIVLLTDRACCVELVVVCILLPICIHRSFGSLEKFAGLSILSVSFCSLVILYKWLRSFTGSSSSSRSYDHDFVYDFIAIHPQGIFPALGSIAFAYVCQHQTYLVYNSMASTKCPRAFGRISRLGVAFAATLIFTLSVPGYCLFRSATRSDIFLNFTDLSDKLIQTCRLMTGLNMVLTYPQEFMVARHTLQSLLTHWRRTKKQQREVDVLFREQSKPFHVSHSDVRPADSTPLHVGLTLLLLGSTLLISMVDHHLGDITSLTGSFSAVALTFVLPAACHLKLGVPSKLYSPWQDAVVPWCTIVFGTVVFFVSTSTSVYAIHMRVMNATAIP
ncbi:unnamed protein product [Aphanomyces euteiches]|uniref:Amino acid transporter transmembrane domain-containing protein n=1 Tax=Aphanomyces euteiches TaxID=100861 RepID=A0A6G0XN34_9STRA|nr:hypothetical protein Ae201684_003034 [Aphanomyces euteiches]KAH9098557.1 hypothetical protein Ae201684P_017769 [Aphanomyces euteiches]KAH9134913.1 hypothetical protein AeRB84_019418 [Aphanomyces euteiches]